MVQDYFTMLFALCSPNIVTTEGVTLFSKLLLLELWSTHQHHQHFLEDVRNVIMGKRGEGFTGITTKGT